MLLAIVAQAGTGAEKEAGPGHGTKCYRYDAGIDDGELAAPPRGTDR